MKLKHDIDTLGKSIVMYGRNHRILKCVEELAELQQALLKYTLYEDENCRPCEDLRIKICDEFADCKITMKVLEIMGIVNIEDVQYYTTLKEKRLSDNMIKLQKKHEKTRKNIENG